MKESNNKNIHLLYYLALFMALTFFLATFLYIGICQHCIYKVYVLAAFVGQGFGLFYVAFLLLFLLLNLYTSACKDLKKTPKKIF